ncbi:MAG: MoaD/ThiS family protein [Promethearchaeota archaeon]
MIVEVLYFAILKDITGKEKEPFDINENNIRSFLKMVLDKYPAMIDILLEKSSNKLKESISIAVNNKIVKDNNLLEIELYENDKIAILLPFSGG